MGKDVVVSKDWFCVEDTGILRCPGGLVTQVRKLTIPVLKCVTFNTKAKFQCASDPIQLSSDYCDCPTQMLFNQDCNGVYNVL